jgi:polyisoprenoid-binding protein YceI
MATAVQPFAGTYELDRVHSTFQFAVRHLGISTFRATFADVDASLVADGDELRLEASARAESVSIHDPPEFREHVVYGADFFDAGAYPVIAFRSSEVELRPDGTATVSGDLDLHGVSGRVTAEGTYDPPVVDPFGATRAGLELRATIDRRTWAMDWQAELPGGGDAVGWDVEVSVHLELIRAA